MIKQEIIKEYINCGFESEVGSAEFDFICSIVFYRSPVELLLNKDLSFEEELKKIVEKRLKTRRPIQQIVGKAYFMNNVYIVNENVLIPRPETEFVVMKAKEIAEKHYFKNFLEIGTGSGCISVELLRNCPNLRGESVDISEKALNIALKNAEEVSDRIVFKQSDLFSNVQGKFDIIISNPPYIPQKDKQSLQTEVRDFEPELALFTEDEKGIDIYKKIITQAHDYLIDGGYLIFEIGHNQGKLLEQLFKDNNFVDFELIKDFDNNDRVVLGKFYQ